MAAYNELSHTTSAFDPEFIDPLYKWDTHFPERFTRLSLYYDTPESPVRRQKTRMRNRNTNRYKTQPVTFDEIKEVDEEPVPPVETENKDNLKSQFAAFSRSMDGLLPGRLETNGTTVPSDSLDNNSAGSSKENISPATLVVVGDQSFQMPIGLSKHESYRLRRKKRRPRKSIEEEPEIECIETNICNPRVAAINRA